MDIAFLHDPTVWVLFSFLIFAAGVWRFGRKAILSMLDARIDAIRDELRTAENLRIEAQELLAQYQRKFRDAAKEADAIVAEARAHASKIRAKTEGDLAETIRRKETQLATRLKQIEEAEIRKVRIHAARLAIEATERMLREKIDEKANAGIVDASLEDVVRRVAH